MGAGRGWPVLCMALYPTPCPLGPFSLHCPHCLSLLCNSGQPTGSPWTPWGECSASCGPARHHRHCFCTRPPGGVPSSMAPLPLLASAPLESGRGPVAMHTAGERAADAEAPWPPAPGAAALAGGQAAGRGTGKPSARRCLFTYLSGHHLPFLSKNYLYLSAHTPDCRLSQLKERKENTHYKCPLDGLSSHSQLPLILGRGFPTETNAIIILASDSTRSLVQPPLCF